MMSAALVAAGAATAARCISSTYRAAAGAAPMCAFAHQVTIICSGRIGRAGQVPCLAYLRRRPPLTRRVNWRGRQLPRPCWQKTAEPVHSDMCALQYWRCTWGEDMVGPMDNEPQPGLPRLERALPPRIFPALSRRARLAPLARTPASHGRPQGGKGAGEVAGVRAPSFSRVERLSSFCRRRMPSRMFCRACASLVSSYARCSERLSAMRSTLLDADA